MFVMCLKFGVSVNVLLGGDPAAAAQWQDAVDKGPLFIQEAFRNTKRFNKHKHI